MAIYVRVNPRSQLQSRYRAGLEFGADWTAIDVDAADRAAIEQDPYLEVSEIDPTEIETAAVETNVDGDLGVLLQSPRLPATWAENPLTDPNNPPPAVVDAVIAEAATVDPVEAVAAPADQPQADELYQAVKSAIATLDKDIPANWLKDGRPATKPLEDVVGKTVSSGLRDLVWADIRTEAGE